MVAPHGSGPTIDLPSHLERVEERMAFGGFSARRRLRDARIEQRSWQDVPTRNMCC
jgi:hypothetical protein